MKKKRLVITIDGPGGAGKSTISKLLAKNLKYSYLDTGALYRALAYHANQNGLRKPFCEEEVTNLLGKTTMALCLHNNQLMVVVNDHNITDMIRNEEIGILASNISAMKSVRDFLLPIQREFGKEGGIVAEGRDMGTVVFPKADVKFFLDASLEERARRRFRELVEKGERADIEKVKQDLITRDRQDSQRSIAPLFPAPDAYIIDSSNKSIDKVLEIMLKAISTHAGKDL